MWTLYYLDKAHQYVLCKLESFEIEPKKHSNSSIRYIF